MSVHYSTDQRHLAPWLPLPTLTDLTGVLAIVVRFTLTLRNARHATPTKESQ